MHPISESVIKKDHWEKVSGQAKYVADYKYENMLCAKVLRSNIAHGDIKDIIFPNMSSDYIIVDYKDIPGENVLNIIVNDQPIFAEKQVNYIGEPILLVVGPGEEEVERIIANIEVIYDEKEAVLNIDDAKDIIAKYSYSKGNVDEAFKNPSLVMEETFETPYQEQAYLEPQGLIGIYNNGKITVSGSMQCPYYIKDAVMRAMAFPQEKVQIVQAATGGGFGGKEDYPSLIGCHVAIAAYKTKKPVRLIMSRRDDMSFTPKRHPSKIRYRTAIGNNEILAMDIDITLDGGAYAGLSSVVLQRAMICATGVYKIPNVRVNGKVVLTNTVPTGAFRGFGAPQSLFALETHMCHIAKTVGVEVLKLKKQHLVKQGDETSTKGVFHHVIKLDEIIEKAEKITEYNFKREKYVYDNRNNRFKKGIGISLFLHGCGFTGSGERDHIKSMVKIVKDKQDKVEILVSNTEIGQGLKTTLSKIVAKVLNISINDIILAYPDTDRVPNSGPTVASRSLMIVGRLLEKASIRLKAQWQSGVEQVVEEHYVHPNLITWDEKKFTGDAYPTYSWGVNIIEVEIDTVTAHTEIKDVCAIFDLGVPIDDTIIKGQIDGGMLQGIGYASMENMERFNGVIRQNSFTDYIIPTSMDTVKFKTGTVENPYSEGPFGAKGAGELTLIGAAPAYVAAVEHALGKRVTKLPLTTEAIMEMI